MDVNLLIEKNSSKETKRKNKVNTLEFKGLKINVESDFQDKVSLEEKLFSIVMENIKNYSGVNIDA